MPHLHRRSAADHPIKSVTIFKSKTPRPLFGSRSASAEVLRTFPLALRSGENTVKIRGLPSVIDTESVRVSGLGADVRLFDVLCTIKPVGKLERDTPDEEIRLLNIKKQTLESEKRVRGHEADVLVQYGQTLSGEYVTPEMVASFLAILVENGKRNIEETNRIDEGLVDIERQIIEINNRQIEKMGDTRAEATITLIARQETSLELKLTYLVGTASWHPHYDLHATTENGQPKSDVSLHYRAKITQSTGEDWKEAALTLSTTSSDSFIKGLPDLKMIRVVPRIQSKGFQTFVKPNNNYTGPTLFGSAQPGQSVSIAGPIPQLQAPPSAHPVANFTALQQQQQAQGGFSIGVPAQVGGLFGSTAQSVAHPTGSSVFGSVPATSVTGGPFDSAPATSVTGGLFGAAPVQNSFSTAHASQSPYDEDDFEELVPPPVGGRSTDGGGGGGGSQEPRTVVRESALSTTFQVDGKASVPSDGLPHQVLIAAIPFEATLTYVAVPQAEAAAYVQCNVKNTSEYRLLPGPVSVFLDESFVSKTALTDISTGDRFECTLGADPLVGITYARTVSYSVTTTIKNRHRFALPKLLVRSSVPLGGTDESVEGSDAGARSDRVQDVNVLLRKPIGLVNAKDGEEVKVSPGITVGWAGGVDEKAGKKEGKLEWVTQVESGAEVKLVLDYDIKSPADANWMLHLTNN